MLLISCICIIGLSGIAAQVILLRELLVSFLGNELTVGIVLANWLVSEACGAYGAGRSVDRLRRLPAGIAVLSLAFSAFFALSVYLSRSYKGLLGIPVGEGIGLGVIFWASLFIVLPVGFTHGALFSAACRMFCDRMSVSGDDAIGRVYAWETIGTIAGGVLLTYFFLPFFHSFQSVAIVTFLNLCVCFILLRASRSKVIAGITVLCALGAVVFAVGGGFGRLQESSVRKQFRQASVVGYRNSVYGNIAVTENAGQFTFFSNGLPVITTPVPDVTFAEELGNLPLAFNERPGNVLVAGAGSGGLLREVLKHPVSSVDYLELDPLLIKMVRRYPTAVTESELNDPRVRVENADARYFLRRTGKVYDVIIIGISHPADLATNRLFTSEFFSLARKRLSPDGVLAFWLPGSLAYLSDELIALNRSVFEGLRNSFSSIRIIPGDYTIFIASASSAIGQVSAHELSERLRQRGVVTALLSEEYLSYRLSADYLEWFSQHLSKESPVLNEDLKPRAVFQMLLIWNKQFAPKLYPMLKKLEALTATAALTGICALSLVVFLLIGIKKRAQHALSYMIGTTGFFGMLATLILVFGFQVYYGYLYHRIGLLISFFMAGTAAGSLFVTRALRGNKRSAGWLMGVEAAIVAFSLLLAFLLPRMLELIARASVVFSGLFCVCGVLVGMEFPLAARLYLSCGSKLGRTVGALYCADLAGGWCAGIIGGVVCFPVLGVTATCALMAALKAGSLVILASVRKQLPGN